jgi:mono/diheme cytochrome c family protein
LFPHIINPGAHFYHNPGYLIAFDGAGIPEPFLLRFKVALMFIAISMPDEKALKYNNSKKHYAVLDNHLRFDRVRLIKCEGGLEMKYLKIVLLSMMTVALIFSFAYAAGNIEKGKALFSDPKAFDAPGEKSCSSCHPDGKGLEKAGEAGKKSWTNPGGTWLALEDANNVCIIVANKGKAIDPMSEDMQDLVAFIRSLAKGSATDETIEKMKEKMMMEQMKGNMPKKLPGY